jgi:mono/diheme cytochrome c family protein
MALVFGCGKQAGNSNRTAGGRGRTVFVRACAGCHTLVGRDTGTPGGDLALARLSVGQLASFARVMPVRLSSSDVHAVALYIRARERPAPSAG